jgi:hypothetical protein
LPARTAFRKYMFGHSIVRRNLALNTHRYILGKGNRKSIVKKKWTSFAFALLLLFFCSTTSSNEGIYARIKFTLRVVPFLFC